MAKFNSRINKENNSLERTNQFAQKNNMLKGAQSKHEKQMENMKRELKENFRLTNG